MQFACTSHEKVVIFVRCVHLEMKCNIDGGKYLCKTFAEKLTAAAHKWPTMRSSTTFLNNFIIQCNAPCVHIVLSSCVYVRSQIATLTVTRDVATVGGGGRQSPPLM